MPVGDRVCRACLHAISAENAPRIINVVNAGIPLPCRDPVCRRIFCCFDVNAVRRASRRAQKAAHAFFQTVFIALQYVNTAIPWLEMNRLVRIVLRDRLPKHISKCHAETLGKGGERLGNFADDRRHALKSNNRHQSQQIASLARIRFAPMILVSRQ